MTCCEGGGAFDVFGICRAVHVEVLELVCLTWQSISKANFVKYWHLTQEAQLEDSQGVSAESNQVQHH